MALIDNIQGYWKLDEASGNAADSTANANTLTNNATVTYGAGKINNAATFVSASSQYFSRTDAAQVGLDLTGDHSLAFWFKLTSWASGDNFYVAVKWASSDANFTYAISNPAGVSRINANLYNNANPANNHPYAKNAASAFSTATWYHAVFTYNLTTETMTFYINGSSLGTVQDLTQDTLHNSAGAFELGGSGVLASYSDMSLDEVGIWNRELTSGEVTSLYNGGAGLSYPFTVATSGNNFFAFMPQ